MFLRISLAFALLLLAACSGGGRYLDTGGKMCDKNYMPMALTNTSQKAQKISIEPEQGDLAPADYAYNGADVFYFDPKLDIRIFFQDVWSDKQKTFSIKNGCVRGLQPGQNFSASITGVTSINVENSLKSTFTVRNYEVVMANKKLSRSVANGQVQPGDTPSKVFDNEITDYNFYKLDETNYELRVKAVSPTTGQEMWLIIRYVKKPFPAEKLRRIGSEETDKWLSKHPLEE